MIPARPPTTTFPSYKDNDVKAQERLLAFLYEELSPILILSDPEECNKNISIVLKSIVDFLIVQSQLYHLCSKLALKVLQLNLFVKNFRLCIGKLLMLIEVIGQPVAGNCDVSTHTLEEFILVIFLLLLKLSSDLESKSDSQNRVDPLQLMLVLEELGFFGIVCNFISRKAKALDYSRPSYVLLKFNCDIIFQYLYEAVLLSEEQFDALSASDVLPNVISHLLSMGSFDNYNVKDNETDDMKKLISYEEFKLVLLINEQYMMRLLTTSTHVNRVFECLCVKQTGSTDGICAFTNILVYHMNREQSHIIKILMLKFLYLVFTSSYSAKLPYLNDLKILVDIIVRELNDLNYCSGNDDESLLALTYIKVLFPLLKFSQLNDLKPMYKQSQITDVLTNIIINGEIALGKYCDTQKDSRPQTIVKTAVKCLSTPSLKATKTIPKVAHLMNNSNDSSDSLASNSSLSSRASQLRLQSTDSTSSTDSFSLARVSSVRATKSNDYNKTNERYVSEKLKKQTTTDENLDKVLEVQQSVCAMTINLHNSPPFSPSSSNLQPLSRSPSNSSSSLRKAFPLCSQSSSIAMKAKLKKAPPPPPPPPRQRRMF